MVRPPPEKRERRVEPSGGARPRFEDLSAPPEVMSVVRSSSEPTPSEVGIEGRLPDEPVTSSCSPCFERFDPFHGHDILRPLLIAIANSNGLSVCSLEVLVLASSEE